MKFRCKTGRMKVKFSDELINDGNNFADISGHVPLPFLSSKYSEQLVVIPQCNKEGEK